ncbi:MAG: YdeI/OmpD-associated family protein [Sphingomonadales bacterium]|nr:YdeI/OmpD-associated family protein [Sphingomonadales bacterium]
MSRDPRIDAYIAAAPDFARPILEHLRVLVHAALPEVAETIKWSRPHFTLAGKLVAGMSAFKAHAAFMIHGEGRQGGPDLDYGKITGLSDLPSDAELTAKLHAVRTRIRTGERKPASPRTPRAEIAMPADVATRIAANPAAQATWDSFAPSHRREYLEWITEAKQDATREKRIAQAIEWLGEGRKRNWKYEKC